MAKLPNQTQTEAKPETKGNALSNHKPKLLVGLAVALLLIIVLGVALAHSHHNSQTNNRAEQGSIKLDSFTYNGKPPTASLTLQKPVELVPVKNASPANYQDFNNRSETTGGGADNGSIRLYINSASYSKITSSDNQAQTYGILKLRFPDKTISVVNSTPFTNPYIKTNAWVHNFTATGSTNKLTPITGKVLYILNGKDFYLYVLSADQATWQANQATWLQMLNSIKLNQ